MGAIRSLVVECANLDTSLNESANGHRRLVMSDGLDVRCPILLTCVGLRLKSSRFPLFVLCNLAQVDAWPTPCPTPFRAIWILDRRSLKLKWRIVGMKRFAYS